MPGFPPATASSRLIAYFPSDAIHARDYQVSNIPAGQLTHIIYAFAAVSADGECASVSAKDDRVSFPELVQLKKQHPKLRTLISIGGAAHSANFAHAAATRVARHKLAQSCVHFMKKNGFDGIDIDWEFPGARDTAHYTALLAEIRRLLDAQASSNGSPDLLTISAPADPRNYAHIDLDQVHGYLDWINLMAYGFYVPASRITDFDAPLYPPSDDPAPAATRLTHNVDAAVKAYLEAEVPADKLVVGVHFTGTGWQGVTKANNGLYQTNTGPGKGTWEPGRYDYKDLAANYLGTYARFWNDDAQVPWLDNPATGIMISYDDPQSLTQKVDYVLRNQLGGVAVWQITADDAQHTLLSTISALILPGPTSINLSGANLSATVLENLESDSPAQAFINDTLNSDLKLMLVSAATNAGQTVLASLLQAIPAVDVACVKDVTLQAFVSKEVALPTDAAVKAAAKAAIAKISTTTTVGDLLGLNSHLQDSPLFASEVKKVGLATLLQTSSALVSNPQLVSTFVSRYAAFQGPIGNFWQSLGQDPAFTAAVPDLQLTLQLGTLTLDNPTLVSVLRASYPALTSPRDLASLSVPDWQYLITSHQVAVPDSVTGSTPEEKISNYAHSMAETLAGTFPSVGFLQELGGLFQGSRDPVQLGASVFLNNANGFDIINTNLASYLTQNSLTAFKGIDSSVRSAVTAHIASWQRVARVSPDFGVASALMAAGFGSAYKVASTPRASFIQRLGGTLGSTKAAADVHTRALQIAGTAMGLLGNVRHALSVPTTRAIGDVQGSARKYLTSLSSDTSGGAAPGIPTWQTLFGPQSYCACTDCRSVYSAAAYFVDLLQFLEHSGLNAANQSPLDVLLTRRPDLPYIKLNCENTNTELPYVDLVNEILEGFVVLNNGKLDPTVAHDTPASATAAELSVSPEYTNDAAYSTHLNGAIYPPTLPYDRWLDTARTYLNFLGSSLYEIMSACQTGAATGDFNAGTPSAIALACEFLNISQAECLILTGADFSGSPQDSPPMLYQYYGYNDSTVTTAAGGIIQWEQDVSQVETFLQRMLIGYDDLVALLETRALNPNRFVLLQAPAGSPCDLSQTTIVELVTVRRRPSVEPVPALARSQPTSATVPTVVAGILSDTSFDNFHKFIKLWKKLGWAIEDLDKTMTSLSATQIDQQFLVSQAAVQQLQAALNLPLTTVLSFWSNLDTDGRDSFYLSLFQNKAVLYPPDPAFQLNYRALVGTVPASLQFPSPAFPNLVYYPAAQTLARLTALTSISDEPARLLALSGDPSYTAAIDQLSGAASDATLVALPSANLPSWLHFDAAKQQISFTGSMPDASRQQLNFSSDPIYQAAFDSLYDMRTIVDAELLGTPDAALTRLVTPIHPGPIPASATLISVTLTGFLPSVPFVASIGTEQVLVTSAGASRFGGTWTVTRGYNNTTATDHNLGDRVFVNAISNHVNQILAALRIGAQDLALIRAYTGLVDTSSGLTPLNLANLSTLCRYAFLAQGLGLSVSDLIIAIQLIGIDPFQTQAPEGTLIIVQSLQAIQASPFSIDQLNYLYRNAYDPNAGIAPLPADVSLLLTSLQAGLANIAHDDAIVRDPKGDLLLKALGTLLGSRLAGAALGLINGTAVYSAPLPVLFGIRLPGFVTYNPATVQLSIVGAMSAAQLAMLSTLSADPTYQAAINNLFTASQAGGTATYSVTLPGLLGITLPSLPTGSIAYDSAAQQLRFTGPMSTANQSILLALLPANSMFQAAVKNLQQQPVDFINANFANPKGANFLAAGDAITQLIENPQATAEKVAYVAQHFMPYLQQVQSRSLVTQTLCDNLGLNPTLGGLLLNAILKSQVSPATPNVHAMADFLALAGDGLSATYYPTIDLTGTPALTRIDPSVDFNWGFGLPDVSTIIARPFSVRWSGFVMPQYSEEYTFDVRAGDGMRLWVNGQPVFTPQWNELPTEVSGTISLSAGRLYSITLEYYDPMASAEVSLSWSSASTPKAVIPQSQLFSGTLIQSLTPIVNSYTLLFKSALLVDTFPLSAADVAYLSQHGKDFEGVDPNDPANSAKFVPFDLNGLPLDPSAFTPALFNVWERLNAVVALRQGLPGGDAALLSMFSVASTSTTTTPGTLSPALSLAVVQATGWNPTDLGFLASMNGFALSDSDFKNEIGTTGTGLNRLQSCVALLTRLGISAQQLFSWASFGPDGADEQPIAQDIQNTAKSKYDDTTWVAVGKPLNDTIRESSKEALIAYILARATASGMTAPDGTPLTTSDQLYEFFLIDVDMSPCMLTSRIVQASAAVQLFVQRSLMSLELRSVSPSAIDAAEWEEWRKNFRVWQAARQVFLYPENWMIPALRDDKTPIYQDLEDALLQNPITNANVEKAYLNYLFSLNDVARLDIRATYWQLDENSAPLDGKTPDASNDVLHVFARTTAPPYRYYYRRLLNCSAYGVVTGGGALWTPWELVDLDIPADHLIPVIWDGRLYLFWPIFTQVADPASQGSITIPQAGQSCTPQQPNTELSISLSWSEYQQGEWSAKLTSPPLLSTHPSPSTTSAGGLDTSSYSFNSMVGGNNGTVGDNRDALTIQVYVNFDAGEDSDFSYGVLLGNFIFSGCGSTPWVLLLQWDANWIYKSIPENCTFDHNSVASRNATGLSLTVASTPDSPPNRPVIEALSRAPSGYDLMFPHQFSSNFGLAAPYPYQAQPFFFQDDKRVYFVTNFNPFLPDFLADASRENPSYSRASLMPTAPTTNGVTIFAGGRDAPTPGASTAATTMTLPAARRPTAPATNVADPSRPFPVPSGIQIVFSDFFHPFVCSLIKALNRYGLSNLLSLNNQALTNDNGIISGMVLSDNLGSATPAMTPGLLISQGQLYESKTSPDPNLGAVGFDGTSYLYFTPKPVPTFYYQTQQSPRTPGDAYLGQLSRLSYKSFIDVIPFSGPTVFEATYAPNTSYILPDTFPREVIDFRLDGAYSIYNWELFFHIPLLIATQLSQNQQFEDAQSWFHYLFNPTSSSSDPIPQRYWKCLPFYECSPWDEVEGQIQNLFSPPAFGESFASLCGQDINDQIAAWAQNPFDPYLIGRMRTIAFRMKVVMAYLDNLIAWGDSLFGQNTRESINEATQIYILAKDILGPRPVQVLQQGVTQDYTYNDLRTLFGLDSSSNPLGAFSNVLVLMENDFPSLAASSVPAPGSGLIAALGMSNIVPYFCSPPNDTLLGYWDTVDDRLYKIRHCMNIQGVVEQLALFAPPISPALLVAAAAAGVDLSSVLSNTNAGTPFCRFSVMTQKALELCAEVRSLGSALLAALEKQDAETISLLRATQESSLLQAMQTMKQAAVEAAQSDQAALQQSLQAATARYQWYALLLKGGNNPSENQQMSQLSQAGSEIDSSGSAQRTATLLGLIPTAVSGISGAGGSPIASLVVFSADVAIAIANAEANYFSTNAAVDANAGNMASVQGQWDRRAEEWGFQSSTALIEMAQIDSQITAAGFRVTVAQEDQKNLNLQIQHAQAVHDFLAGKYTNTQLYSWMVNQTSAVFFQCYQMAYDLAARAEAAFRFERGLTTSTFIRFGGWDSLKKGLMSGERLYADLKRMEIAYLESDVREYEVAKSISLVLFDPWALINLKQTGQCQVNLPEAYFDMDYPGHYFRRLKTVSLTIPCVTGPYTSVNCTLSLLNSKLRIDSTAASKQDYSSDAHFITNYAATQSIATSTAQNDSGLFEVNFRDERYLPFEGAGLISTWQIDMPQDCNAFDFDTITDVVINLRYTARYGGDRLRGFAKQVAVLPPRPAQSPTNGTTSPPAQNNLQRLFSLKHEFPTEWYKFLHPADTATAQNMSIALGNERFPFQYRGKTIKISQAELVLVLSNARFESSYTIPLSLQLGPPVGGIPSTVILKSASSLLGGAPYGLANPAAPAPTSPNAPPSWTLHAEWTPAQGQPDPANEYPIWSIVTIGGATYNHLNPAAIDDIFLICQFAAS